MEGPDVDVAGDAAVGGERHTVLPEGNGVDAAQHLWVLPWALHTHTRRFRLSFPSTGAIRSHKLMLGEEYLESQGKNRTSAVLIHSASESKNKSIEKY